MDKLAKPQIISHIEKSVDYSLFDAKWIPCSAKFVVMGSKPRGTGIIQIYEISNGELKLVKDISRSNPIKCGTFKSSNLRNRHLATGDFKVCDHRILNKIFYRFIRVRNSKRSKITNRPRFS